MHDSLCRCFTCLMGMAKRARINGAFSGARFAAQDAYQVARNAAELATAQAFITDMRGL
jgi:hypothetical protein